MDINWLQNYNCEARNIIDKKNRDIEIYNCEARNIIDKKNLRYRNLLLIVTADSSRYMWFIKMAVSMIRDLAQLSSSKCSCLGRRRKLLASSVSTLWSAV
jgi:hypothetical protein